MSKGKEAVTLADLLDRVPKEHRAPLEALAGQLSEAERGALESALPPLIDAIDDRDYPAFSDGMDATGHGAYTFILWSLLVPADKPDGGDPDKPKAAAEQDEKPKAAAEKKR